MKNSEQIQKKLLNSKKLHKNFENILKILGTFVKF